MRSDRSLNVTFRLRHLKAVYGRNLCIPKINPESIIGVFFAISPLNAKNSGYCFISEVSANSKNPDWEHTESLRSLKKLRSSKEVLFSFFLQLKDGNILLFELELHFSGLLLLDSEMRDNPLLKVCDNQIFLQLGSHIYAPHDYLKSCNGFPFSPVNRSPQLSYSYNSIQRFLINMESSQMHVHRMTSLKRSIDIMKDSLKKTLYKEEKREELFGRMLLLQNRLGLITPLVSASFVNSKNLAQRLSDVGNKLIQVNRENDELSECIKARLGSITLMRNKLSQVNKLLTLRATQMLAELDDIFSSDIICPFSNQSMESIVTESGPTRNMSVSTYRPQSFNTGYSFDSMFPSWNSSSQIDLTDAGFDVLPDACMKPPVESDLAKTSTALGYAAYLLTLLAVVLDQPIVYPLEFTDGFARTKIMDLMTPCITDSERILPLSPTKTTAISAYKNASRLLLWNVISLRARFGLSTPSDRSVAWNLKSLVDYFRLKDSFLQ